MLDLTIFENSCLTQVQFKNICLPVKANLPPTENRNETLDFCIPYNSSTLQPFIIVHAHVTAQLTIIKDSFWNKTTEVVKLYKSDT